MVALMDLLTATQILEFSGINNDQKPIFLIDQDLFFKSLFMPFKARRNLAAKNIMTSNNNGSIYLEFLARNVASIFRKY